jgi:dTDP-4-amino-4,6-dideoxygalactose transaminase
LIKPWLVKRAARHQLRNLAKVIQREPVLLEPLSGMTLDMDDVVLARELLGDRDRWFDDDIVARYETEFARWNGSLAAFAFMGGRVALSACIEALELAPGDEVILPAYTCVVVPNALIYAGVKPVYCDIELDTFGLSAEGLEPLLTSRTRAVLLHHLYGLVCRDYDRISCFARRHGLAVIEDCAHATGAMFHNSRVGNRSDFAFYSSEQSKVFNTIQGGVAVTNDRRLATRLADIRARAPLPSTDFVERICRSTILQYYRAKAPQRWWRGDVAAVFHGDAELVSTSDEELRGERPTGYGARMPGAIAELALNQLRKIDRYNEQRRDTARHWDRWCDDNAYRKPTVVESSVPVFLRYPVLVEADKKADLSWARSSLGIEPGEWFLGSLHPLRGVVGGCPRAAEAVARCVNFPCLLH